MTKPTQPLRWTRLSVIALSLVFLLGAAVAFAASPLGAQAPLGDEIFPQAEPTEQAWALFLRLTGDQVVPPVASDGTGAFTAEGEEGGTEIRFNLTVSVSGITQAHIHLGGPDENGGVVAFLFGPSDPPQDEVTIDGVLTEADLLGSVAGDWGAFVAALFAGAYVQVDTTSNPAGELRGQILVARPTPPAPGTGADDGAEPAVPETPDGLPASGSGGLAAGDGRSLGDPLPLPALAGLLAAVVFAVAGIGMRRRDGR